MSSSKTLDIAIDKLSKIFMDNNNNFKLNRSSIELLKKSNISRKKEFERYSFDAEKLGLELIEIESLRRNKIIFETNNKFILTFKGIIIMEYSISTDNMHVNTFLDDLNKNFFEKIWHKTTAPFQAQEKAIIITLLGLGCFSKTTALTISSSRDNIFSNTNEIRKCIDSSIDFLKSIGYGDRTLDNIWTSKVRGEDPVVAKFRRVNDIRMKGDLVEMSGGKYYLNLISNGELNTESFEKLLDKLFDKKQLDVEQREMFNKLLKDIDDSKFKVIINQSEPDFKVLPLKYQIQDKILSHYNRGY